MGPNHPPHTEDAFGNIWTSDRPIRSRLSAEEFSRRFAGYGTIVVEISSDRIFAAGNDEQQLAQGFHAKDLDVSDFQLEAGPLDHLDLSAAQLPDRLN